MATAVEDGDASFVSILDEESREKARTELQELNDKDRLIAVQTFRRWVLDQDWLKSPTDFEFLLRFLRTRKFSQLGARQTLENYWTCKTKMPEFYKDIDPKSPVLQQILKAGFMFGHKSLDKDGRRIVFVQLDCFTVDEIRKIGIDNIYRAYLLVWEWFMFDENSQVNGVQMVIDYSNTCMQQFLVYTSSFEGQKNTNKFLMKSLPIRLKRIHFYNEPVFFDVVISFFSQFMTDKIKQRLHNVGKNLAELYKDIDKSLLLQEYLPDDYDGPSAGSKQKIIDDMITDMTSTKFYDYIRDVSSGKYGVDLTKRSDMEKEPAASFRKLNVD